MSETSIIESMRPESALEGLGVWLAAEHQLNSRTMPSLQSRRDLLARHNHRPGANRSSLYTHRRAVTASRKTEQNRNFCSDSPLKSVLCWTKVAEPRRPSCTPGTVLWLWPNRSAAIAATATALPQPNSFATRTSVLYSIWRCASRYNPAVG